MVQSSGPGSPSGHLLGCKVVAEDHHRRKQMGQWVCLAFDVEQDQESHVLIHGTAVEVDVAWTEQLHGSLVE